MNAQNPLYKAVQAAIKELSTPEAIDWYQEMAILTVINTVKFTMTVTAFCCDLVETWLLEPQEFPAEAPSDEDYDLIDLVLPASPIAGLLMPAKEVIETVKVLITPAKVERVLVTPPSIVYNLVKSIMPTLEYSGGGAATSCQGYLFYRR